MKRTVGSAQSVSASLGLYCEHLTLCSRFWTENCIKLNLAWFLRNVIIFRFTSAQFSFCVELLSLFPCLESFKSVFFLFRELSLFIVTLAQTLCFDLKEQPGLCLFYFQCKDDSTCRMQNYLQRIFDVAHQRAQAWWRHFSEKAEYLELEKIKRNFLHGFI